MQNRIAYIVYGNPREAKSVLQKHGFEPPRNIHQLVHDVKDLVRKKGRVAVKELVSIHPDRRMIMKWSGSKDEGFCTACKNYSYNSHDDYCPACGHSNYNESGSLSKLLDTISEMDVESLNKHYQDTLYESNQNPEDKLLAEEVQILWNELRKRINEPEDKNTMKQLEVFAAPYKTPQGLVVLGVAVVAGVLIANSIANRRAKC